MRIGFDAKRFFANGTGLGNYSRTLVANLARFAPEHALHLFSPRVRENHPEAARILGENPALSVHHPHSGRSRLMWRRWQVVRDLRREKIDLFHGLSNEVPFGLRRGTAGPRSVVTLHDVIHRLFPADYPLFDRLVYDFKVKDACLRADIIVVVSTFTGQDVVRLYGVDPARVKVVYQTCAERFFREVSAEETQQLRQQWQLPAEYALSVGTINRRKNLMTIVRAWQMLSPADRLPLVVVGKGGDYAAEVKNAIKAWGLEREILFRPEIPSAQLPCLYQASSLFLYPSLYEGFGIPVLEALASGVPAITSKTTALPEVGGDAALLVDPTRAEDLAVAIMKILQSSEERTAMIQRGKRHAERFRAEQITQDLLAVYRMAMEGN